MPTQKGGQHAKLHRRIQRRSYRAYRSGSLGINKTAASLGVAPESLRSWIKKYDLETQDSSITEREELRRLKRENAELREEREILRKAAAFFAKETTKRN